MGKLHSSAEGGFRVRRSGTTIAPSGPHNVNNAVVQGQHFTTTIEAREGRKYRQTNKQTNKLTDRAHIHPFTTPEVGEAQADAHSVAALVT